MLRHSAHSQLLALSRAGNRVSFLLCCVLASLLMWLVWRFLAMPWLMPLALLPSYGLYAHLRHQAQRQGRLVLDWSYKTWRLMPADVHSSALYEVTLRHVWRSPWWVCIAIQPSSVYHLPPVRYVTIWYDQCSSVAWRSLHQALHRQHLLHTLPTSKEST